MTVEYDADKLWIEIYEKGDLHYLVKYDWVVKYRAGYINSKLCYYHSYK